MLRGEGIRHAAAVDAVVLETDGSFSVMRSVDWSKASTLQEFDLPATDDDKRGNDRLRHLFQPWHDAPQAVQTTAR